VAHNCLRPGCFLGRIPRGIGDNKSMFRMRLSQNCSNSSVPPRRIEFRKPEGEYRIDLARIYSGAIPDSSTRAAAQLTHVSSSSSSSSEGTSAVAMVSLTASAISSSSESAKSTRISRASAGRILPTAPMAASSKGFGE
jgi:hypothetical protein